MANNITINVLSYDRNNLSMMVNFTDGINSTANVHVNPHVYGTTDPEEMLKMLATTGYNMLLTEANAKKVRANTVFHDYIDNLINQSVTLTDEEILGATISNNGLEVKI
jgi:hypothetical protein